MDGKLITSAEEPTLSPLKSRLLNFRTRLFVAMGAAVAALLLPGLLSYRENLQHQDNDRWVPRTHCVLETPLESLLADLLTAESNPKEFLLSGNKS